MKTATGAVSLLFDLDGTLVDSLRDIAEAMNAVLEHRGFPTHPVEAYRTFVGDGMERLIVRTVPNGHRNDKPLIETLLGEMKDAYAERWRNHADPYPGIRDLLSACASAGVRLGVLSNKPETFTREMVAQVFPDVPFDPVRGAREGVPVKPAPDAARDILAGWETTPDRVVYVGDTDTDMRTGRNAGLFTVGVTWGFRDRAELAATGADQVVDTPAELLETVRQKFADFPG